MIDANFSQQGYEIIRSAITPELRSTIATYMSFRFAEDDFDPFLPPQKNGFRDPIGNTLFMQLQSTIEDCTGLSLLPTFSVLRLYGPNSELERHSDKRSCEIVASICISYEPEDVWPIYVKPGPEAEPVEIRLDPGDLVVYWGKAYEHWRHPYNGKETKQIMLCFVDANGPHAHLKYGGIESIQKVMEELKG